MSSSGIKAGGVFVEIGADPTKFFAALKGVNKSIGSIGKAMSSAGTKMAAIGAGVVGPIFASAAAFANVGSVLNDMSKRTGVATESLSVLQFAAEQTGTDMGGVETALKKMQKAIFAAGTGSKEAADALAMVGLSASDLEGLSADQQMGKIADGLMAIQDPGARAAVAMKIFGKSGTDILPMLEGGSAGMAAFAVEAKRLGLIMDSETAAKADSLGDAIDAVKASMKMAFIQVGGAVAPILTQLAQGLAIVAANVGKFISENQAFVVSVLKGGAALVVVGSGVAVLGRSITLASTSFSTLGKAASLAVSPLTMLIGGASGVAKSFTMAMPATLKLANSIGSSMLGASASVTSFAATAGSAMAGFAVSGIRSVVSYGNALQGVFASQFRIARFIGQSFGEAAVTAFSKTAMSIGVVKSAVNSIGKPLMSAGRGVLSLAAQIGQLAMPLASVAASSMSRFVSDIAGGLAFTYKSFVWWATGASARMAQYAASLAGATGKTIASTAAMSAAWLGSAARGVAAFVGSAVAGIGTYLGAGAMAVAGSVASAAAVAAAWLAPLAPLLLLSAAAVGVGVAVKQFGPQIAGAFSGLAGYVTEAGGAIAGGFSTAVSDGIVVLGDLATTATTTFNGVYEAVAAGDLSGAMDVLWAGLVAGWLRGTEALMSYVDPWVAAFQDVFTNIGVGVVIAWDKIYTDSAALLNTMGAFIMGFFDNIANGVMATFDNLVAGIQIAWTTVQGFITGATDTEQRIAAIKDENAARAEQRMQERPGVNARTDKAAAENAQAETQRQDRAGAIMSGGEADKAARQDENAKRAADRRAGVVDAETKLGDLTTAKQAERDAAKKAAEELAATTGASAASPGEKAATAGAGAAGADAATSKAEVAGTFSSVNLGGMGFGSSLAERTAKAAEETAKNTRNLAGDGKVAA
jgi:hypothetical protein